MTLPGSFRFRRAISVVAVLCFSAIAAPLWAQFETRATTAFPPGIGTIATGDFNHDGKVDVVMTTGNGFSVALGNGDGTFQSPVTYATQLSYSLAVADFNNDGNLDIVVANENQNPSTVSVYLGNGDGTFQPPIDSNTTNYNEFVIVGDFNGDGKMDIVVIENPHISVLLGNGDGTFQTPSDNDSFVGAHWLAVGDFNNDHKLDVLVTGSFGSSYDMGVLLGNGDGTLQDSITTPLQYVPAAVAAADLNHDGNMDAILGYDLDGLAVFLGNGDGTFQPAVNYVTTGIGNGKVVVSDLNLDGRLDVAVPSGTSGAEGVDVFWGNGDGTLQLAQFFSAGFYTGPPVVAALNGDRLPDLAFETSVGLVTMLNTGVLSFSPTSPLDFPTQLVNTTSAQKMVTLTNTGKATLLLASVKVSGPFRISNTCSRSIAVGANCTINAQFQPTVSGEQKGLITLVDSASPQPQFVELKGNSTAIRLSPSSLDFGNQQVGTQSTPRTVTATNKGAMAVTFTSVGVGIADEKNFSSITNCTGHAIQPGATCIVSVTFHPSKTGAISGALYFDLPRGSVSPDPVTLSGTGT